MSDLAEKSKVILDLWDLFIVIVSLNIIYISSGYNDFGFYSFQKTTFHIFSC